jgi:magnesium transporter
MSIERLEPAEAALTRRFLLDYPYEAARQFESMPTSEAARLLTDQPPHAALRAWEALSADVALEVMEQLPEAMAVHLLAEAEPVVAVAVLNQMEPEPREAWLGRLNSEVAYELRGLLAYADDCAGRMMDPRVQPLRTGVSMAEAIERLRQIRRDGLRELFVVDDDGRLTGRVEIQDLALSSRDLPLADITRSVVAFASDLDSREDVVETLQNTPLPRYPWSISAADSMVSSGKRSS